MIKLAKFSTLSLSLVILTACGGGGSSGSSAHSSGTTITPDDLKSSITYVEEQHKDFVRKAKHVVIKDQDNKVVKTYVLADLPKGTFKESFTIENVTEHLRGLNLAYSASLAIYNPTHLGIAKSANITGLPTPQQNIPTTGTAEYQGKSLGYDNSGLFMLTADFANKNVSGKIYDRKNDRNQPLPEITLVKGSFYKGTFTNVDGSQIIDAPMFRGVTTGNSGYYTGSFTGPNAEEVVGVLSKTPHQDPYAIFAGEKK